MYYPTLPTRLPSDSRLALEKFIKIIYLRANSYAVSTTSRATRMREIFPKRNIQQKCNILSSATLPFGRAISERQRKREHHASRIPENIRLVYHSAHPARIAPKAPWSFNTESTRLVYRTRHPGGVSTGTPGSCAIRAVCHPAHIVRLTVVAVSSRTPQHILPKRQTVTKRKAKTLCQIYVAVSRNGGKQVHW